MRTDNKQGRKLGLKRLKVAKEKGNTKNEVNREWKSFRKKILIKERRLVLPQQTINVGKKNRGENSGAGAENYR